MYRSFDVGKMRHRARPFWSWNTEVTPEKVLSQIKMFSDMGMGGFVIHSRNGLRTEYMGKRFMDMVKLSVECDGVHQGNIILPPYAVEIKNVSRGKHTLELVAVGNRHNTFGSLHWGIKDDYYGPAHWHKYGDAYSREYRLRDFEIMKCPEVTLLTE